MHALLRSKFTWTLAALALLVGLYAVLGFYAAPALVRSRAIEHVRETYGRELALGTVRIHPFRLQAEVRDLSFPDADGSTPMIAFRRLFVDFQVASLWERALVFRAVVLEAPRVRTVIGADGSLNLAQLVPQQRNEGRTDDDGTLPGLWIQSFALTGGSVELLNQLRRRPVERHFSPVNFTLRDFRTTAAGGGFSLTARSRQDEAFEWRGRFALAPRVASTGEFAIRDLRVPGVAEFLGEDLPFLLPSGLVDLGGRYDLDVGETLALDVVLPRIVATGVTLRARGEPEDWIEIPSLVVLDTQLSLPELSTTVGEIAVEGLEARVWRTADGALNVDRLFARAPAQPGDAVASDAPAHAPAIPATPARSGSARSEPRLAVGRVHVRRASVEFEDRSVRPAARFTLAPIDLTAREASLDLARPLPIDLEATINGQARLVISGEVIPAAPAFDLDVGLSRLQVRDLQPYATGATDLTIERGSIDATGRASMSPAGTGRPRLSFAGDAAIVGFRSKDGALEQDFLNFERVDLRQLRFALAPDALSIDRVRVVRPFARVIVSSDQVLNVAAVFDPAGTAAALATRKAEAAARAGAAGPRKKSRAELRAERRAAVAAAKARAEAPPPPAPELRETGLPIRIREVSVAGGTLDFADYSVEPDFAASIQALEGRVTGLSSDPRSRATVTLEGNVGEFSPVRIEGSTQPFAFDRHTDIGLRFENVSLPVFNPYSGKFAGYNIAKGKLTTDLHYRIDARRLEAQHRIRLDQLEWGEATAARGEATLPVRFATALLKDADGVITLDVPVSGTLDDPTFRLGPLVWQVIRNVLSKAVTAPFRALGALFEGAEEAQFVEFDAGLSALDPAQDQRLAALGRSLATKPELRLDVPIGVESTLDGAALARARYAEALAEAMSATLPDRKRDRADAQPAVPAFDTLDPSRRLEVLTTMYRRLAGADPVLPEPPAPADGLSRQARKAQELQVSLDWLEAECRRRALPSPGEFERLGQQRGEAIQRALLADTGLAPDRVFLTRDGAVTAAAPRVRFELAVK